MPELLYQIFVYYTFYFSFQNPKSHTEESPSETSGETIPSDSGHGGSEEDFTSHSHNNNIGKYFRLLLNFENETEKHNLICTIL